MKLAKRSATVLAIVVTALCAALPAVTLPAGAPLSSRTSDSGGVRVVVTPKAVEPGAAVWEFEVVMDTHTRPLNEDLARAAVLVDGSGRDLATQVQSLEGPKPRLIAVSGYGSTMDVAASLEAGFDDHLVKPVELQKLLEALAGVPVSK